MKDYKAFFPHAVKIGSYYVESNELFRHSPCGHVLLKGFYPPICDAPPYCDGCGKKVTLSSITRESI